MKDMGRISITYYLTYLWKASKIALDLAQKARHLLPSQSWFLLLLIKLLLKLGDGALMRARLHADF